MPFVQVYIHAVWGTKNRFPFLTSSILQKLCVHISANAKNKGIHVIEINGYLDHVHCLFGLNTDMPLAKHLQLIKGESSFWLNKQRLFAAKFEWADEYFASSVSESRMKNVIAYIKNQQEHHKRVSFSEEYDSFLRGFTSFQG